MVRNLIAVLVLLPGVLSAAWATDLDLTLEAAGCYASAVVIGPSCETPYIVVGELTDTGSDGHKACG